MFVLHYVIADIGLQIGLRHFETAFAVTTPRTTIEMEQFYRDYRLQAGIESI